MKTLVQRITEAYQGEDGNWVIPKTKVRECKFLKEAVTMIKALQRENRELRDMHNAMGRERDKFRVEIENLKTNRKVKSQAAQAKAYMQRAIDEIEHMQ